MKRKLQALTEIGQVIQRSTLDVLENRIGACRRQKHCILQEQEAIRNEQREIRFSILGSSRNLIGFGGLDAEVLSQKFSDVFVLQSEINRKTGLIEQLEDRERRTWTIVKANTDHLLHS